MPKLIRKMSLNSKSNKRCRDAFSPSQPYIDPHNVNAPLPQTIQAIWRRIKYKSKSKLVLTSLKMRSSEGLRDIKHF